MLDGAVHARGPQELAALSQPAYGPRSPARATHALHGVCIEQPLWARNGGGHRISKTQTFRHRTEETTWEIKHAIITQARSDKAQKERCTCGDMGVLARG